MSWSLVWVHDGRDDVAGDVEILGGRLDADEGLELVAGLAKIDDVVGFVGFEVAELKVEALEVELAEVAGFEAIVGDVDFVAEVLEAGARECEGRLGDEHVGEGGLDGEFGLTDGVFELGPGLAGGGAGVFEAPLALLTTLEET